MGWHMFGHGFGMFGGGIFMLFFWGLIILGILYLIRGNIEEVKRKKLSREFLEERYARGEIDRETFLRMIEDIE